MSASGQGLPGRRARIKSPCVGICELDEAVSCRGRPRTLEAVAKWITYSDPQRERIISDLDRRRAPRLRARPIAAVILPCSGLRFLCTPRVYSGIRTVSTNVSNQSR